MYYAAVHTRLIHASDMYVHLWKFIDMDRNAPPTERRTFESEGKEYILEQVRKKW